MHLGAVQGVKHDHQFVRQSLALVRVALASPNAPPEGHAFWPMVRGAAASLALELPRHFREEEAEVFAALAATAHAATIARLQAEHVEILALAEAFAAQVEAAGRGGAAARWGALRETARRLEALLGGHMAAEEAWLHDLARG